MSDKTIDWMVDAVFLALPFVALLSIIFYVLWGALHITLTSKYDDELFREPYFSKKEIKSLNYFPLNFLRSALYILLISFRRFKVKRRFQGLPDPIRVNPILRAACTLFFTLLVLIVSLGVTLFIAVGYLLWVID